MNAFECPATEGDDVRQSCGVGHAETETFSDYSGEVGEGLDVLLFLACVQVGENFSAQNVISTMFISKIRAMG